MLEQLKKIKKLTNIFYNNYLIEAECNMSDLSFLLKTLKDENIFLFDQLLDITAVDYPSREFRFNLIYIIQSLKNNKKLILQTSLKEDQSIESITSVHKAADWYERECYDLFGIEFLNHPDLRRIMTAYNFEGHPLRKDFPLTGRVQVKYDTEQSRVVYEPVNLIQEYRDFDFLSPWERPEKENIDNGDNS